MARAPGDPIRFDPAMPRERSDGWSPARQRLFIDKLAECGSVQLACDHVGMSTTTAYRLRAHPTGASLRDAWHLAIHASFMRLSDMAMERVHNGTPQTIVYKGEATGERQVFSDKLLMFMLTRLDPMRYERFREISMIDTWKIADANDQLMAAMRPIDEACDSAARARAAAPSPARENSVDRDTLATFQPAAADKTAPGRDRAAAAAEPTPDAARRRHENSVDRDSFDTFQTVSFDPQETKRDRASPDRTSAPLARPPFANSVAPAVLPSFRPTDAMKRDFTLSPSERAADRRATLAG